MKTYFSIVFGVCGFFLVAPKIGLGATIGVMLLILSYYLAPEPLKPD
jgi:hypothetical protein